MKSKLILYTSFLFLLSCAGRTPMKQNSISDNKFLSQSQIDLITKYVLVFPDRTQLSIAFIANNNVDFIGIEKVNNKLLSVSYTHLTLPTNREV